MYAQSLHNTYKISRCLSLSFKWIMWTMNGFLMILGMLPLTFDNPADYDKVQPSDKVSILGLAGLAPGKVCHNCLIGLIALIKDLS